MAAAFRSVASTTYGSRTNTTITAPAGIQDGDVLTLALFVGASSPPTATLPSGFTLLSGFPHRVSDNSGFNGDLYVATKVASSESGDYTAVHTTASTDGFISCHSGSSGTVQATHNYQTYPGSTATATATGLTTGANDSAALFIAQAWDLYGSASPPSGSTPTFTERRDAGLIYMADGVLATAGATGNKSHLTPLVSPLDPWQAVLLEIRAGGSPPVITGQPLSVIAKVGDTATFTESDTGGATRQWQVRTTGAWTDISGATSSGHTTPALTAGDSASYRCNVTNTDGTTATSEATLTVALAQKLWRRQASILSGARPFEARQEKAKATLVSSEFFDAVTTVTASSSATLALTGSATAAAIASGASSGTVTMTGVSTATGGGAATADSSGMINLTGTSTGAAPANAASSATVTMTGSSAANAPASSASAGTIAISGSATAAAKATAASSATISLTGASTATAPASAASSVTINLTGTSTGTLPVAGSSSATVALAGTSTATAPAAAASSVTVSIGGSATAAAPETASSSVTISMSGSSTASTGSSVTAVSSVTISLAGAAAASAIAAASSSSALVVAAAGTATAKATAGSAASFAVAAASVAIVIARASSAATLEIAAQSTATSSNVYASNGRKILLSSPIYARLSGESEIGISAALISEVSRSAEYISEINKSATITSELNRRVSGESHLEIEG